MHGDALIDDRISDWFIDSINLIGYRMLTVVTTTLCLIENLRTQAGSIGLGSLGSQTHSMASLA